MNNPEEQFRKSTFEIAEKIQHEREELAKDEIARIVGELIQSGDLIRFTTTQEFPPKEALTYVPYEGIRSLRAQLMEERDRAESLKEAIEFTLECEDPLLFLKCWNEGDFEAVKRNWPEFSGYLGEIS